MTVADVTAFQRGIRDFHQWRWPDPSERAVLANRLADLGELLGAVMMCVHDDVEERQAYPRCLSAAGRRVSEAGIDAMGLVMSDLYDEPLLTEEHLYLLEAKHTTDNSPATAFRSLGEDLEKTDELRLRDHLRLLQMKIEQGEEYPFPERLCKFLETNVDLTLAVLADSSRIDASQFDDGVERRFAGTVTAGGVPVRGALLIEIEELEACVAATI